MRSTFSTPFREEFARRCIMHYFPELGWDLELNSDDPPDLIDNKKGVGVEVTQAISMSDAELNFYFEKYVGKEINEIPTTVIENVERSGGQLLFVSERDKEVLRGCLHQVRSLDYDNVIEAVVRKTERLNKNEYPIYTIDAIFIDDVDSFMWDKGVPLILDQIKQKTSELKRYFALLMVFCGHHFFLIDTETETVCTRNVTDEEISMLQRDSLYALGREREYEDKNYFLIEKTDKKDEKC